MRYENLTINQKISLKGCMDTMPELDNFKAVAVLWGWIDAINLFLDEDYIYEMEDSIFSNW